MIEFLLKSLKSLFRSTKNILEASKISCFSISRAFTVDLREILNDRWLWVASFLLLSFNLKSLSF